MLVRHISPEQQQDEYPHGVQTVVWMVADEAVKTEGLLCYLVKPISPEQQQDKYPHRVR